MNPHARRFVLLTLGLALGLSGGLALLNLLVDPFNRYGLNRLGVYISAERESKASYVRQSEHDALLLGNSRETRIPPARLEGFRFFNAAFSGATPEEIYYFLHHFAGHLRLVVLAVDLGASDPVECHGDIFAPKGYTSALDNLFNLQTTEYSIRTISESLSKHSPPIGRDGWVPPGNWGQQVDRDDPAAAAYKVKRLQDSWQGYHCPPLEKMSYYVKISETLRQQDIPCVVVIPPMHEAVARTVQSGDISAEVMAWKRELRTIFPHVVDLSFSSYGAATNFYRLDPLHFKPEAGVQFLNVEVLPFATRLLHETPPLATATPSSSTAVTHIGSLSPAVNSAR